MIIARFGTAGMGGSRVRILPAALAARAITGAIICLAVFRVDAARAQSLPDDENGRYALAAVQGSVVRLDTRTGKISTCRNGDNGWACFIVPDERAAYDAEIGRLLAANAALKAQLAQRDPSAEGNGTQDQPKTAEGERKLEIPLPSDRDMDRVMTFLENAWRRLIDMANRIQRGDNGGKL